MGQAGRRRAEKYFDENLVFERIQNTYQELLERKGMWFAAA
jgi:hypothetical protein